jgi:choline dehydrogenase-like flavoprotein
MRADARRLAGRTLEADLCVIGGGPAGLTVARELIDSGLQVVLLESGGDRPEPALQSLSAGRTIGDLNADLSLTRHRGIGGTAGIWNTRIGTEPFAKLVPLDPVDFLRRPWQPWSGWPFPRESLDAHYDRAGAICGLSPGTPWEDPAPPPPDRLNLPADGFTNSLYRLGPARQFTSVHPEAVRRAANVRVCSHTTVTELVTDPSGRSVAQVLATCGAGAPLRVHARAFVLAAGGIENARLLLLSNRRHPAGLGNSEGLVGRCFMEHPRDFSCVLVPRERDGFARVDFYDVRCTSAGAVRGRLALTEAAMLREGLPNFSVTLRGRPAGECENGSIQGMDGETPTRYFHLEINVEQSPDPRNRVVLGRARDRLGQPRVELHWRWRDPDWAGLTRARGFLAREIARSGLGRVLVGPDVRLEPSAHHHLGTTRMSLDPRRGVVDADARVHGVDNLFVAGSSVFPTGGFANPTLTVVALALRLADHLRMALGCEARREATEPSRAAASPLHAPFGAAHTLSP